MTLTADVNGNLTAFVGSPTGDPIMAGETRSWQLRLAADPGTPTGTLTLLTQLLSSSDGGQTYPTTLSTHSQRIDVSRVTTTTSVSVQSVSTSTPNAPVPMRATVFPPAATGTVTFSDNGTVIGAVPLVNGVANLDPVLGVGTHVISASYSGDDTYATSTGTSPTVITVGVTGRQPAPGHPVTDPRHPPWQRRPVASVPAGRSLTLQVTGRGNIPAGGVTSVVVNLDVTTATKPGALTAYATGSAAPYVASLNFDAGRMTSAWPWSR